MFQPTLEKLFDRYRRRGDAAALAEVFDRTSGELHKLALHLVRDPAEAEDVLQNAYLAAIESAPSYDSSRPLIPWLVGILANQAAIARRRSRREVEPDRLERRGEPQPNEAADLAEFSSKLGDALAQLPEPYAEVLRLHLADGKKSIDIARELGREPGTVRMQVHRGLDLLRRALPAGFATGAVVASLSTSARAATRERVLTEAVRRGATVASVGAGAGTGLLIAKVAGVAVALGTLAYFVWPDANEAARDELARATSTISTVAQSSALDARAPNESRSALTQTIDRTAPSATELVSKGPWLDGTVSAPTGLALDAVTLQVRALVRGATLQDTTLSGPVDAAGRFRIDLAPLFESATRKATPEELVVTAEHPRTTRGEARVHLAGVERRASYDVALELGEAGIVTGRVVAPLGLDGPVEVGLVAVCDGAPCLPLADSTRVGADGIFRLRSAKARDHLLVAFANGARPLSRAVRVDPGVVVDVGELALARGLVLEGSVTRAGEPVEHAMVGIATTGDVGLVLPLFGVRLAWRDGELHRTGAMVETDANGRFRAFGFEPGLHRLEVVRGDGAPLRSVNRLSAPVLVEAPGTAELEIASARLELEVLDGDRRPARGTATLVGAAATKPAPLAEDGILRLDVAPFERQSVRIESLGQRTETFEFEAPGPGETLRERVWLLRDRMLAALSLVVASPDAITSAELELDFTALDVEGDVRPHFVRRAPIAEGRARFADLPAGRWNVRAFLGGAYRHFAELRAPCEFEIELAPTEEASHSLAFTAGGRVRIDVVDEQGRRVAANCAARDANGRELALRFVARGSERVGSAEGRLSDLATNDVYPNLAPGEYVFVFSALGRVAVERRVTVEAGKTSELAIELAKEE
ncbi:MAG: sigma-70 family RNA polymerase sigma factor [Planctomycetes bacterium]|nr:sigma-70 family RNA polymerase sigma factor [Planctomycetota bacterium]